MYKSQPVGQMHAMGKEILRQTYKGLLKKYVLPRRYTFYEVKPKVNLHFKFNYYDDWKSSTWLLT